MLKLVPKFIEPEVRSGLYFLAIIWGILTGVSGVVMAFIIYSALR